MAMLDRVPRTWKTGVLTLSILTLMSSSALGKPPKFVKGLFGFGKQEKSAVKTVITSPATQAVTNSASSVAAPANPLIQPSRTVVPNPIQRSNDQYLSQLLRSTDQAPSRSFVAANPMLSRVATTADVQPQANSEQVANTVTKWMGVTQDPPPTHTSVASTVAEINSATQAAFQGNEPPATSDNAPETPAEYANIKVPGLPDGAKVVWVKDHIVGGEEVELPENQRQSPNHGAPSATSPETRRVDPTLRSAKPGFEATRQRPVVPPGLDAAPVGTSFRTSAFIPSVQPTATATSPNPTKSHAATVAKTQPSSTTALATAPSGEQADSKNNSAVVQFQQRLLPEPPGLTSGPTQSPGPMLQGERFSVTPSHPNGQFSPSGSFPPANQLNMPPGAIIVNDRVSVDAAGIRDELVNETIGSGSLPAGEFYPGGMEYSGNAQGEYVDERVVKAEQHLKSGFEIIKVDSERAEEEFIAALTQIAHARDQAGSTRIYSEALDNAITAMWEADEFARVLENQGEEVAMTLANDFRTQVGRSLKRGRIAPHEAVFTYQTYARQSLAIALGKDSIGSQGLYGMARLFRLQAEQDPQTAVMANMKAMTFLLASAAVDSKNWKTTNELGVLFASEGDLRRAENALRRSIDVRPTTQAWNNLARIYDRQGKPRHADHADSQAYALRSTVPSTDPTQQGMFVQQSVTPTHRLLHSTPVVAKSTLQPPPQPIAVVPETQIADASAPNLLNQPPADATIISTPESTDMTDATDTTSVAQDAASTAQTAMSGQPPTTLRNRFMGMFTGKKVARGVGSAHTKIR